MIHTHTHTHPPHTLQHAFTQSQCHTHQHTFSQILILSLKFSLIQTHTLTQVWDKRRTRGIPKSHVQLKGRWYIYFKNAEAKTCTLVSRSRENISFKNLTTNVVKVNVNRVSLGFQEDRVPKASKGRGGHFRRLHRDTSGELKLGRGVNVPGK